MPLVVCSIRGSFKHDYDAVRFKTVDCSHATVNDF